MAQSMKAVTADAPFSRPFLRKRISSSSLRQRRVKSGIERGHLRKPWQHLINRVYSPQAGWVVKRSQLCQLVDCALNFRSDHHGRRVPVATMDHTMAYSSEVFGTLQRRRRASLQVVENLSHGVSLVLQLQLFSGFGAV